MMDHTKELVGGGLVLASNSNDKNDLIRSDTTNGSPDRQSPVLGIRITNITGKIANALGYKELEGIIVKDVVEGGSADNSGINSGMIYTELDDIITKLDGDIILEADGKKISSTSDVDFAMKQKNIGDTLELKILRAGNVIETNITLAEKSILQDKELLGQVPYLGLAAQMITPKIAELIGLSEPAGLLVTDVEIGGGADLAGLMEGIRETVEVDGYPLDPSGDVIVAINGHKITNGTDIARQLSIKEIGDTISMTVLRDGLINMINVTVTDKPTSDNLGMLQPINKNLFKYVDTKNGINMTYPSNWYPDPYPGTFKSTYGDNQTIARFFVVHDTGFLEMETTTSDPLREIEEFFTTVPTALTVLVKAIEDRKNMTLVDYNSNRINELKKDFQDFKIISTDKNYSLAGYPALKTIFQSEYLDNSVPGLGFTYILKSMEAVTLINGTGYVISYSSNPNLFSVFLDDAEKIIRSIKVTK